MSGLVEISKVVVRAETEKALLIVLEEGEGAEIWVPRSVIDEEESEVAEKGDEGTIVVKEWFAQRNDELKEYV